MNHIENKAVNQIFTASSNENINSNLRQAIKIINADYQPIDWEDQAFLNRVLTDALTIIENKKVSYVSS